MIANALLITIAVLLAVLFWLMGELGFLIPYRSILYHQYGTILLVWLAIAFANVFSAVYALERKFFLKDTGRKLSHIDKQIRSGQSPVPRPHAGEEP
jgi:p-aminobenzoyl-glutamate transporter AbgT